MTSETSLCILLKILLNLCMYLPLSFPPSLRPLSLLSSDFCPCGYTFFYCELLFYTKYTYSQYVLFITPVTRHPMSFRNSLSHSLIFFLSFDGLRYILWGKTLMYLICTHVYSFKICNFKTIVLPKLLCFR